MPCSAAYDEFFALTSHRASVVSWAAGPVALKLGTCPEPLQYVGRSLYLGCNTISLGIRWTYICPALEWVAPAGRECLSGWPNNRSTPPSHQTLISCLSCVGFHNPKTGATCRNNRQQRSGADAVI